MHRSAARCRMANRSPGRRRIVIRSRAGPPPEGRGSNSGDCASSHARMAISASVDSDMCRWAASAANTRFSCGVGRAVIVGAIDFKPPSFTARNLQLQQNADTSLSCHQSNTTPIRPPLDIRDNGAAVVSLSTSADPTHSARDFREGLLRREVEGRGRSAGVNGRRDRTAPWDGLRVVVA
jgi:hypothetical protein